MKDSMTEEELEEKVRNQAGHIRILEDLVRNQKVNIRAMQESLELKNKELDALYHVWCDGGCPGGVHRYNDLPPVTDELVNLAEGQVHRLRMWYINHEFRNKSDKLKWKYFQSIRCKIHKILRELDKKFRYL